MCIGTAVVPSAECSADASGGAWTAPLVELLDELARVVVSLTDEQYVQNPAGAVTSSVGAHVRHCLDHVRALLSGVEAGTIDYDSRRRGTNIETSRWAAILAMRESAEVLHAIPADAFDRPVEVSLTTTSRGPAVLAGSTLGREAAYVLSHTIHHNALIGAMVKTLGGSVPPRFGYAPATLAYLRRGEQPCAR